MEGFIHEETVPSFPTTPPDIDSSPPNNGREAVDVPVNKFKPCPVLIGLLGNVDPLQQCTDHGRSILFMPWGSISLYVILVTLHKHCI